MNRQLGMRGVFAIVGIAAILAGVSIAVGRRPVVVHAFADTDCACGDFHEKVTGLLIWNPLRDRIPERVADRFLAELRADKCSAGQELCAYALPDHRISDWRLVNREDSVGVVNLFFKLTKYGVDDSHYELTGEGAIQLQNRPTGWKVVFYGSYF